MKQVEKIMVRKFQEFSQFQGVTGLGLAITKKLIELHGGHIMVCSQGIPGLGTSFHILLPFCTTEEEPESRRPKSPVITQVNGIVSSIPSPNSVVSNCPSPISISPEMLSISGVPVALCVDDDPINQVFSRK
jgi:hypothetical protein